MKSVKLVKLNNLEDSCSLFELILGDEVVRQLLEQLQHVLVILDHRPVCNYKRVL